MTAARTMTADFRTIGLCAFFHETFAADPAQAVRAPGRVNLIGEHTDYNDGFCLPMAIERDVRIVLRPRADDTVRVASQQQTAVETFAIGAPGTPIAKATTPAGRWSDYLRGCTQILRDALHADGAGALRGLDLALTGDVPLGSGLSSSAALEVATMLALLAAAGKTLPMARIARLAQKAENAYVGTNCGILDQLSSACAVDGEAMLMDCRTLALTPAALPAGVSVVIADTGKRRGLVDSAYNERRAGCEAGAKALGVSHLRDVTMHGLWRAAVDGRLGAQPRQRCEHVVAENGRTQAAFACLKAGDAVAFGQLMDLSHADLRDRFEVSCRELDDMVETARKLPGCLGARMTGAGFGGCAVALVQSTHAPAFADALLAGYGRLHPALPAAVYVTGAAPGAGPLAL
jgi:galactokinase